MNIISIGEGQQCKTRASNQTTADECRRVEWENRHTDVWRATGAHLYYMHARRIQNRTFAQAKPTEVKCKSAVQSFRRECRVHVEYSIEAFRGKSSQVCFATVRNCIEKTAERQLKTRHPNQTVQLVFQVRNTENWEVSILPTSRKSDMALFPGN